MVKKSNTKKKKLTLTSSRWFLCGWAENNKIPSFVTKQHKRFGTKWENLGSGVGFEGIEGVQRMRSHIL